MLGPLLATGPKPNIPPISPSQRKQQPEYIIPKSLPLTILFSLGLNYFVVMMSAILKKPLKLALVQLASGVYSNVTLLLRDALLTYFRRRRQSCQSITRAIEDSRGCASRCFADCTAGMLQLPVRHAVLP